MLCGGHAYDVAGGQRLRRVVVAPSKLMVQRSVLRMVIGPETSRNIAKRNHHNVVHINWAGWKTSKSKFFGRDV
jgi:hypothetical protein